MYIKSFNIMTMMSSKLHMTIRVLLLVAVVFFSTGFTSVVKYCTMSHSSECCCESDHSDDTAPLPAKQLTVGQNCVTVKIVGGLSDTKATVNSETFAKPLTMDIVALISVENPVSSFTLSFPHSFTNDLPPPNGDICIRVKSLLI